MTREQVIASRADHIRRILEAWEVLPEDEEGVSRRGAIVRAARNHCDGILRGLHLIKMDKGQIMRMVADGSAPPWDDSLIPRWNAILEELPPNSGSAAKMMVSLVEERLPDELLRMSEVSSARSHPPVDDAGVSWLSRWIVRGRTARCGGRCAGSGSRCRRPCCGA